MLLKEAVEYVNEVLASAGTFVRQIMSDGKTPNCMLGGSLPVRLSSFHCRGYELLDPKVQNK